jgi:periplasmic protein TonB
VVDVHVRRHPGEGGDAGGFASGIGAIAGRRIGVAACGIEAVTVRAADFIEGGAGEPLQRTATTSPMPVPSADEPPRAPLSIWALAALGAILIHAGFAALALGYLHPEEASDDLGAPAIEIDVELEAPHRDPADLPPGPAVEASAASPEVAEQKTVVEETDLPKATPTETNDPDRVVSPNDTTKPDDDAPKKPAVQTAPSNASIAAEATAMPSPQSAQEAPRSTAPDLGTGESLRRERTTWQKELAVHLEKYKRYPQNRPPESVAIVLRIVLDRTGHVVSAEVAKSSGDAAFDNAAIAMMRRADPVPPPPPLVADEGLTFSMPVIFRVNRRS